MTTTHIKNSSSSINTLIADRVASRIHAKDATLFDYSPEAQACAQDFMGWTDLATSPVYPLQKIKDFAASVLEDGLTDVVLIGQGGSTQAPMTITKYNKIDSNLVNFRTLDSDSPVRVRETFTAINMQKTLFIVSSKSGSTIEPRVLSAVVREILKKYLPGDEVFRHFVAITDPGSDLEQKAKEEGWRAVFLGEPSVGGRFSALSVFGLLPAALVGIDIDNFIQHAAEAEEKCSQDSPDNPAIVLAAFLYDNYVNGRNKFCFLTPKRGRVLGLWIEQLVAESLGKEGKGILPNIEIDSLILRNDLQDRTAIIYQTHTDLWDEQQNFEQSLSHINRCIPQMKFKIKTVEEVAEHFVMWEYAIAICGYLMKLCPFDQPDVASSKAKVKDILNNGCPKPNIGQNTLANISFDKPIEVRLTCSFKGCTTIEKALRALFESINPGDYFALNAFLPFTGEGRREALEVIRHGVADHLGVVSCLEVGPRYLHSTGQLQKGGPNTGVFLIISAGEFEDIGLSCEEERKYLGELAKAQAVGDFLALSEKGRRCLHLHLPNHSGVILRALSKTIEDILEMIS